MHGRGGLDIGWRLAMLGGAVLAGSALQLQQASAAPAGVMAIALVASLVIGWFGRRRWPWVALALATAAFAATDLRASWRLAQVLPPALEGQDLPITARVVGLPQDSLTATRFVVDVERPPPGVPPRLALSWFRGPDGDALLRGPPQALAPGQRWAFTVRLKRPHGAMNPHGFDVELWLFERGLGASGYVRASPAAVPQLLAERQGAWVDRARFALRQSIQDHVRDERAAGVLAALVVGDQGAIDRDDWALFRDTGVAHLMAISGLHVTMFAWLAAALVGRAWRWSPRAMLAVPAPVAARWGGFVLAAAYALLAGWGVPAQRTLCMLCVVAAAQQAGLRWPGPFVLLAAAVAVALLDPWALLQPGFWLSFGAVGLLMLGGGDAPRHGSVWLRLRQGLVSGLRTQAVATVGLAPLTLLFFQQVSLVGFVANLVAIPTVSLLVTPLAMLGALWAPLWSLAAAVLQALISVLQPLGSLPVWQAAAAPDWAAAAGLLGGALLVLPLPWRVRWLGLPLLLPLVAPLPARPDPGRIELVAVDVGQGTAVLVRTQRHLLVYDAGPRWSPESDAGDRILRPLLQARGETRVDALVLSHRDTDHTGGAASLLHRPLARVWSSLEPAHPLLTDMAARQVPHAPCRAGEAWTWDGVQFTWLHPVAPDPAARPNTQSCVLRVEDANGRRALLTGDLEAAQEAALALADTSGMLRADVMMVPHHGSRTSSTAVFLDRVAPRIAFVQAAYRSRFGHPAPDVLARYAERGITVVRSDSCGAWTWDGDGPGVCTRQLRRRYWHHRMVD
ncbi:MAG: DNA internalization-related competence protein ComEC/Rec2 [Burkholderiaceae bacterium]|nr:DNA internalization-related competence protein ComEC/Rec2 [Burkholderiaceae bacterium]